MPEICFSTSFTALKSRKFKQFMYFNPGRKYLLRNGNVVPGEPFYLVDPVQPGGRRLNPAAFSVPASGQQGNLPRNYFRAFAIDQADLAVSRQINITERVNLYLRVEYFNIFNHPMFSPYNNISVGIPDFGTITQTLNKSLSGLNPLYQIGGPRSGQLTLKLQF